MEREPTMRNTREMLEIAVELLERFEREFLDKAYLTESQIELGDDYDEFMEEYNG